MEDFERKRKLQFDCTTGDYHNIQELMQGWIHPTLARHGGQWVIWSDKQTVFVPLDKAAPELLAACPGAWEAKLEDDLKPF